MAQIVEVELPEEYINKNKYEIYTHLEQVSIYAHKLKEQVEDLQAEVKLRDLQLQKQRADILKLKSYVGHQNIKIKDIAKHTFDRFLTIMNLSNVSFAVLFHFERCFKIKETAKHTF